MASRISTGIRKLDEMLHGGLIPEATVLVRGAPGTGKTTLGLQFLLQGIKLDQHALLVTFEEFPKSIYRDAANLGWDLRALEERNLIRILFTSPEIFIASMEDPVSPMSVLIRDVGVKRLVLDSMTHFRKLERDSERMRHIYNQVANAIKREGITSLLLSEAPNALSLMADETGHLLYVVDGVILLSYVETDSAMCRAMTILKMRGTGHAKDIRQYEIGQGGIALQERFKGQEAILSGAPRFRRDLVEGANRP